MATTKTETGEATTATDTTATTTAAETKAQTKAAATGTATTSTTTTTTKEEKIFGIPVSALSDDEQNTVSLIDKQLASYCANVKRTAKLNDPAVYSYYDALHGAFRMLLTLRGQAHVAGARTFISYFAKYGDDSLSKDLRARMIEGVRRNERIVFIRYLDRLDRFQKCKNKANFRKETDLEALLEKFSDATLREAVNSVFPG